MASSSCPTSNSAQALSRINRGVLTSSVPGNSARQRRISAKSWPWSNCSSVKPSRKLAATSGCPPLSACSTAVRTSPWAANHWLARRCRLAQGAALARCCNSAAIGAKTSNQSACSSSSSMNRPRAHSACSQAAPSPTPSRCSQS